jgi:hypothetical protein
MICPEPIDFCAAGCALAQLASGNVLKRAGRLVFFTRIIFFLAIPIRVCSRGPAEPVCSKRDIGCKEKELEIHRHSVGSRLHPKSAARNFPKRAELFASELSRHERKGASPVSLFGSPDAEANIADGFAAEALF